MCVVQSTSEQRDNAPITYAHIKQGGISPGCAYSNTTEELFTNNVQPHNHEKASMQMRSLSIMMNRARQAAGEWHLF